MELDPQTLANMERPAQYLGGELNSVVKNEQEIDVHLALAFPDTYEVGMSHVGIQILYDLVNRCPYAWAERTYMPLPDMEEWLRENDKSLFSLESQRPLKEFDIIGFSLQYELCGTNILSMLDLAGLEFYADRRKDCDPIIIGGGPYSYHPEPLAPFFDVFFLGDAEEFIPELLELTRLSKQELGKYSRDDVLKRLESVNGIYLPAKYSPQYQADGTISEIGVAAGAPTIVTRRLLPSMVNAPFPEAPVVPNTKTVHNRLSLEVMRGCVRGCRFCQAGYLYRPQRERSPQEVVSLIENILPKTGYEEVSLLSLSTADYCSVVPLLRTLMDSYGEGDRLSISCPSTRVDALTPEVLEQVQRVRRTNFTIAPEGGTQRLRDVINKGVSDEQILETCSNVFKMGWSGIKLYFMLGLPTETDEDLQGIVEIAKRIRALEGGHNKDITVSVSTHVPKPHTPFQWSAQVTPSETIRKQRLIAKGLARTGINFRYHDAFSSFLEGIFCRGGRELAPVIERAYRLGARLDAWQEHLSEEIWNQAFESCDLNPYFYLRERPIEEVLPWEHLSCGIPKTYFAKEYKRSLRDKTTPDCLTTSCSVCGACNYDTEKNILWPREESESWYQSLEKPLDNDEELDVSAGNVVRYRFQFIKEDLFQLLGHLELVATIHRSMRRAQLPVAYSKGFHPLPKIAFGPPLQLGVASESEFFDACFDQEISATEVIESLNHALPQGLKVVEALPCGSKESSLSESIEAMRFSLECIDEPEGVFKAAPQDIERAILDTVIVRKAKRSKKRKHRKKKNSDREFVLGSHIKDIVIGEKTIEFTQILHAQTANPRPLEIAEKLTGLNIAQLQMKKLNTYFRQEADLAN